MHILLAGIVTVLTATVPAQSQSPRLMATEPITLTFQNTVPLDQALSFLSRMSGVVIEISKTVPDAIRQQPVSPASPISIRDATLEQALETLTQLSGLSFSVVDAKVVFIFKKP